MNPYKDEWEKAIDDILDYMLEAADLLSECTGNTAITIADNETPLQRSSLEGGNE